MRKNADYGQERDYASLKLNEYDRKIDGYLPMPPPNLDTGYIGTQKELTIPASGVIISLKRRTFNDTPWFMKKVETDLTLIGCSMDGTFSQNPIFQKCAHPFFLFQPEDSVSARVTPGEA